ncbi:MAG: radical SAM family heme chaperone HemW [Paludibacteraceae bacterium]|nr:radical SAM family heme chaperone HemW [Paludibacteraceae bacterium]
MAGIYIHIPFCKQRCTYCDFYTQVAPQMIPDLVNALCREMDIRSDYNQHATIDTIYFGGGTPSLLSAAQFNLIFSAIFSYFSVCSDAEITFEANPDDLSPEFFSEIRKLPFNRISIGIQSFDDNDLKAINRRHTAQQAESAIMLAREAGFRNISIDLIYGLPGQTLSAWEKQLDKGLNLQPEHISIYGLTYEKDTKLWKQREKGLISVVNEEQMIDMYELLIDKTAQAGYEAYEISNFAKPGFRSRHNSAYWKLTPFIGLGPSAHSFDGNSRQWNIASTRKYIDAIAHNNIFFEKEALSDNEKFNDFVMISLRTKEGIDTEIIYKLFGSKLSALLNFNVAKYIESGHIISENKKLFLSLKGIHISDAIISDLMFV